MEDDLNFKEIEDNLGNAGLADPSFSWAWLSSAPACYYYYDYFYDEIGQSSSRHSSLKSNLIGLVWIASWAAV